jgi:hypothetical protein
MESVGQEFVRLLTIAGGLEEESPFGLEIVTICCEVVCLMARKSNFGEFKGMVFALLLKWLAIAAFTEIVVRCFSFFFEHEDGPKLAVRDGSALLLVSLSNSSVRTTAKQIFDRVENPRVQERSIESCAHDWLNLVHCEMGKFTATT